MEEITKDDVNYMGGIDDSDFIYWENDKTLDLDNFIYHGVANVSVVHGDNYPDELIVTPKTTTDEQEFDEILRGNKKIF